MMAPVNLQHALKVQKVETMKYLRQRALAVGSRSRPGQTWEGESADLRRSQNIPHKNCKGPKKFKDLQTVSNKDLKVFYRRIQGSKGMFILMLVGGSVEKPSVSS